MKTKVDWELLLEGIVVMAISWIAFDDIPVSILIGFIYTGIIAQLKG